MVKKMYEYIEKNSGKIKNRSDIAFNNMRLRMRKFDELNIANVSHETEILFKRLEKNSREFYDGLLEHLSKELGFPIGKYKLDDLLMLYSATLLYSFSTEYIRKQNRYFESILAIGDSKSSKILENQKRNARLWNVQVEEFAVDIEWEVTLREMKEKGIQKVKWVAMNDAKRCKTCDELNGQTFDIDKVPKRPHIGCRCILEAVKGGDED